MTEPDRRQTADRRKWPERRADGRRLLDDPRVRDVLADLELLAANATKQGRTKLADTLAAAIARLEELEAALHVARARAQAGGKARAEKIPADQRRASAKVAADARWHRDTTY
jgi:hypothetical protein